MVAIGLQNIPEGLAVSVAAVNAGLDRRLYAAIAGIRAGAVEIPLAVLGAVAVATIEPLLPYAMGFAAGAMLFVISDEIIPERPTGVGTNAQRRSDSWRASSLCCTWISR